MKSVRCLVEKCNGDFIRATELGYSVNLHCAGGYMWLKMPFPQVDIADMNDLLKSHGFTKVSEVEYL